MNQETLDTAVTGAAAGFIAAGIQALIGKSGDLLMLPEWEDADYAPRLMQRLTDAVGIELDTAEKWELGTLFHFGYGAAWGAGYAALRERFDLNPTLTGLALGGLIYGITFPRWGGAVLTGTERPSGVRTRRMTMVDVAVTSGFGLATAYSYEWLRKRTRAQTDVRASEADAERL